MKKTLRNGSCGADAGDGAGVALIALNIGGQALEKRNGWRVDLSFNGITTQSRETEIILDALDKPVHIWALFRKGNEDAPLLELLDRYAAASPLENHLGAGGSGTESGADSPVLNRQRDARRERPDRLLRGDGAVAGPGPGGLCELWHGPGDRRVYLCRRWTYERSITMPCTT